MRPSALFDRSSCRKPWHPRHLRWVMQDIAGVARQPEQDHRTHLRATLEWLCRAQDACRHTGSGSIAAGWCIASGWQPADTATTGRLIETFLPAADYLAWPDLARRARAMLDALLEQPDTGEAGRIHGLIVGYAQLGHPQSLARAVQGSRMLASTAMATPEQHASAAHALAAVGVHAGDAALLDAARRHLDAALARQTPCGWFADQGMPVPTPVLVGIARSLIETAHLLDDERAQQAAQRIAQGLHGHLRSDGWLAGAFDDGWMPTATHASLPGLAQSAGCWLRFAQITREGHWRDAAWRALAWIKRNQRTAGGEPAKRGALPGAVPIWAGNASFGFETLGVKYFADALMMDMVGITIPPEVQKAESA